MNKNARPEYRCPRCGQRVLWARLATFYRPETFRRGRKVVTVMVSDDKRSKVRMEPCGCECKHGEHLFNYMMDIANRTIDEATIDDEKPEISDDEA